MNIKKDRSERYWLQLPDGATDQYPQIVLIDNEGTPVTVLNLTHLAAGHYYGDYTYEGDSHRLISQIIVFSDEDRTVQNTSYKLCGNNYDVVDWSTADDFPTELEEALEMLTTRQHPSMVIDKSAKTLTLYNDAGVAFKVFDCYNFDDVKAIVNLAKLWKTT